MNHEKPNAWLRQIFDVQNPGELHVLHRSKSDVEKYASISELVEEAGHHSAHVLQTSDMYIIILNATFVL